MKKSIFKKIGGLFLGLAMGLGVAAGVTAGNKASEVNAGSVTIDFNDIINGFGYTSGTKSNLSYTKSNVTLTASSISAKNGSCIQLVKSGTIISTEFPGVISSVYVADCKTTSSKTDGSFKVQGSTNGSTFVDVKSITGLSSTANSQTITFDTTKNYSYFKIVNGGDRVLLTSDIKVTYEEKAAALPLSISGDSTVYNGKTITLSASSNGTAVSGVTWSSSNTGVATVSNTGDVTGVGGTTSGASVTITAKKDGYEDATKTITVKADTKTLQSISASGAQSTFTLGDSFATTGLVVTGTYSHTNGDGDSQEQISTGITTSPAAGTKLNTVGSQTVTVNAGGKSTTYSINVNYAAVESVELDYEEGTLGKGAQTTLPGVTIEPANANQNYSWSDPVATEGIVYTYDPSTHELAIDANNVVEGTIQFTATATGNSSKTAIVVYSVQAAQIANITGVTASATGEIVAKQYVGDAFDPQGFSFAPTWSEGDHDDVVITANDISWNALVAGSNPTGTYSCADGEFTVIITGVTVVNDTVVSIAFTEGCDMTKKSYLTNETWNFGGLSIVGTMDSGRQAKIDSSKVSFSTDAVVATSTTQITVTAHYQGYEGTEPTKNINVTVTAFELDHLIVNATKTIFTLGDQFSFAGTITGYYNDNKTTKTVTSSEVNFEGYDPYTEGTQTVTASLKTNGSVTGTYTITVNKKTLQPGADYYAFADSISVGDTVVFYAPYVKKLMTSISTTSTKYGVAIDVELDSQSHLDVTNGLKFDVIAGSETGSFSFKNGTNYLRWNSGNSLDMAGTDVAKNTSWYIDWSTYSGHTCIKNANDTSRIMLWNYGSPRFACYASQTPKDDTSGYGFVDIYKRCQTQGEQPTAIKLNASPVANLSVNEGDTVSKSHFNVSVLYNTGTSSPITDYSIVNEKYSAGSNEITINYGTFTTKVIVNAAESAHLDHIEVVEGTGTRSFTRGTSFNSTGLKIKAYYSNTDKTKFPDRELSSGFTVTPLTSAQMNVADTYDVSVSYTENGVTKNTIYSVTVTPKVSTSVTIAGDGIEGSNGAYTLASGVTNEVDLTLGCDGDETAEFVQGDQNVVTFANGKLSVNSSTKTNEQITVSFKAGSASATLTVNISAAEGIQLISNNEIVAYVGSSFSYDINIQLNNVESATWTLPQGDFVIESETEDNTGFVGTIYFTDEVLDTLTFSAVTGKGETLSVDIEVLAVNDNIKSISAALKSGVTYTAGQGQTFSKDDLTVTYVRDSGANGTLLSSEFTVSGLPEGSFNRVASYQLTITSAENAEATASVTISVGMPTGENLVTSSTSYTPGTPTTSWSKLTGAGQLDAAEKVYIYNADKGYVSGYSSSDATVVDNLNSCIKFDVIIVDSSEGTFRLCDPTSKKEISSLSSNKFTISADSGKGAVFTVDEDGELVYVDGSGDERRLYANGNYLRCYKTTSSYDPFIVYISKTTPGQGTYNTTYSNNAMTATIYNFIALANETYASVCGSEGNNLKPDLTTWRSVLESDEYEALLADTNSYNLLKSAICGEGAYGPDGVYVASGEKQSSDMVIEFLQKYDRVVSNYATETDYNYLGRSVASSGSRINPIISLENITDSTWIIAVVSLVGLTAIGGYFFYRKRKEI